ncbi:oxidoreductase [Cryptococcus bacillisporus CA1873]|uniref:Oxidoreductase n=1 Tax=Cryptococcus bacillisporus CA1873 TaxID=1296111 RepID=A0ABR5BB16_CRYGA|nr:oxidoreductase [Cryptococcus bacillisporus CA1873]|eukprot:KIR62580.1 oxidoreductase [Cryptococcus gattii CA1873]
MPFGEITLNDGRKIPAIAFGTWKIPKENTPSQVGQAIDVGFDHIDTAQIYHNEEEVGQAIKESGLSRNELWVTTKWSGVEEKGARQSIKESLDKLGLEYLDLYLIHSPRVTKGDIKGAWKELETLQKEGKTKSIGVSNFNKEQLQELLAHATVKPVVNQILLHPYVITQTAPLLEYLKEQNIVVEGYSTLTPLTSRPGGPVDQPVNQIAKRLSIKPEQVLLAWSRAKGAIPVTTSSKKARLEDYLDVGDITLTEDDIKAIDKAGAKGELWFDRKARFEKILTRVVFSIALFWLFKAYCH